MSRNRDRERRAVDVAEDEYCALVPDSFTVIRLYDDAGCENEAILRCEREEGIDFDIVELITE